MKLRPVTKFDSRNKTTTTTTTKLMTTSYRQIVSPLSFFKFMVDLEQSGSWVPDAYSVEIMLS